MDYNEEQYYRIMSKKIGCFPIFLLCAALSFVGCKTIRESEIVEIHDTVTTHRIDTVREYKLKTLYDTVHQFTERLVTLNEAGDVVKEVNNHYYHEKVVEKDSTDKYKSSIDSLKAVLNQLHDKQTVVEKKPSWWEQWKWKLIALSAVILTVLLALKLFMPSIRKFFHGKAGDTY